MRVIISSNLACFLRATMIGSGVFRFLSGCERRQGVSRLSVRRGRRVTRWAACTYQPAELNTALRLVLALVASLECRCG